MFINPFTKKPTQKAEVVPNFGLMNFIFLYQNTAHKGSEALFQEMHNKWYPNHIKEGKNAQEKQRYEPLAGDKTYHKIISLFSQYTQLREQSFVLGEENYATQIKTKTNHYIVHGTDARGDLWSVTFDKQGTLVEHTGAPSLKQINDQKIDIFKHFKTPIPKAWDHYVIENSEEPDQPKCFISGIEKEVETGFYRINGTDDQNKTYSIRINRKGELLSSAHNNIEQKMLEQKDAIFKYLKISVPDWNKAKLLDQHKEEFKTLFNQLDPIIESLAKKDVTKYGQVIKSVQELKDNLSIKVNNFFHGKEKTPAEFEQFCKTSLKEIDDTIKTTQTHKGWHQFHPIFRGIVGVFAAIALIPIFIINKKSQHGFEATFYGDPKQLPTRTSEKINTFKEQFEQQKQQFEKTFTNKESLEESQKIEIPSSVKHS
jgi:hypothetical protein